MHIPWAAMKTTQFTVQFNTPAFLGNAGQFAQWRTPPFKALLRQWWRVAYAADRQFKVDIAQMRREEGLLFGHAWLEDDSFQTPGEAKPTPVKARQSLVRIRLNDAAPQDTLGWALGKQQGIAPMKQSLDNSYAWFGLVDRKDLPDSTGIKPAPDSEGTRLLRLAAPQEHMERLDRVFDLINAFGLLGSRSRGGWGSLQVLQARQLTPAQIRLCARPLQDCLHSDWPMALALHQGAPAIWHSNEHFKTWDKAMACIAIERKQARFSLKGLLDKDLRPLLGFASPGRMPSPLRWKVVPAPDGKDLRVRIFAMPHRTPAGNGPRTSADELNTAWNTVLDSLQAAKHLTRLDA